MTDQPPTDLRAQVAARLWEVAEHNIIAEWICCDPIDPTHQLCVKGDATLLMTKALLVDSPEAWKPAPLLDAVMEELRRMAAEAQQQPDTETPAEDPARIDRLRPEFTDHASIESIDAQLQRARSQQRRWHLRTEWLISLRQARVDQKARGEWPAAVEQPAAAVTGEEACDGCGHPVHLALGCTVTRYAECCACDEPIATEGPRP